MHRCVAAAGSPTKGTCHVSRHTLATVLLQGGADVRHFQAILGHPELRTTARYTHVVIDELKAIHQRAHPAEQPPQPLPLSLGICSTRNEMLAAEQAAPGS